jgi:iron complex transport system substrate-binding protein
MSAAPQVARPLAAALALSLLLAAACGGDDDGAARSDGRDAEPAAADGEFPARVEHRYGTTEVSEEPERVVTVGFSDQDAVLAFGVAPWR